MKYVLTWRDGDGDCYPVIKHYYISHKEDNMSVSVNSSEKISRARIFNTYNEADDLRYELNSRIFMGAVQIEAHTDKQMFVKKLENK